MVLLRPSAYFRIQVFPYYAETPKRINVSMNVAPKRRPRVIFNITEPQNDPAFLNGFAVPSTGLIEHDSGMIDSDNSSLRQYF